MQAEILLKNFTEPRVYAANTEVTLQQIGALQDF